MMSKSVETQKSLKYPSQEQLDKLESYLKEFYSGIVPTEPIDGWSSPMNQEFLNELIEDPLQINIHNFHKTNTDFLTIDEGFPIAYRNDQGKIIAIQLRKIDSDKLLLGCGNNPTSVCYHFPLSTDFEKECISYAPSKWWSDTIIKQTKSEFENGNHHIHDGYITIDPSISMNPTIVTYFGWYEIPNELIKKNSIDNIYQEGIDLSGLPKFIYEYEKLTGKCFDYSDVYDLY